MNRLFPELSNAEWIVMRKVWELKKTSAREVFQELAPSHNWSFSTVRTLLNRLRKKGYLSVKKVGNMHFFEPNVSERKTTRRALKHFIERVFNGAVGPVFSHLIKEERLTPSEREKIRKLLEKEENTS